ncbi:MAG: isoprenylcysteine carboxylmethyltransferase family protein [Anaerolineales bacterium]|nr:isoprenylcysteine carboxylmethyltransferase family protein [Anaerolineales bacterium]
MTTHLAPRPAWTPAFKAGLRKRFTQIGVLYLVYAALLFLPAGRLDWTWAWVLLGLYLGQVALNAVVLFRLNPELIARRAEGEGQKGWDRVVSGLWAVASIAGLVVAGLDQRLAWTAPLPLGLHLAGGLGYTLGFALFSWAMAANAFFSTVVRVLADRGHTVCTTGPYRFVRHPGYVGAILQALAAPLLLGSLWGLVLGGLAAVLIVVRTALEDRTLRAELAGYADYARSVRFRLLPGVW